MCKNNAYESDHHAPCQVHPVLDTLPPLTLIVPLISIDDVTLELPNNFNALPPLAPGTDDADAMPPLPMCTGKSVDPHAAISTVAAQQEVAL